MTSSLNAPAPGGSRSNAAAGYFATPEPTLDYVTQALEEWCKNPDNEQLNKRVQQSCLDYLLNQDDPHWFCSHGSSGSVATDADDNRIQRKAQLRDIATFCVRLVGFKPSGKVADWRQAIDKLLLDCSECVKGWIEAQSEIDQKFLRHRWTEELITGWHSSVRKKERDRIKAVLSSFDPSDTTSRSLPVPLVYHILLDSTLYLQADILTLLSDRVALVPFERSQWPQSMAVPAGLLLILLHPSGKLRNWAIRILAFCEPVTRELWQDKSKNLPKVVFEVLDTLARRDRSSSSSNKGEITPTAPQQPEYSSLGFSMTTDPKAFWVGISKIVQSLSADIFLEYMGGGGNQIDIVRLVSGHLGDKGEHWIDVLRTFRMLLDKLDESTWRNVLDRKGKGKAIITASTSAEVDGGEIDLGYAGARLHDALDNPRFASSLEGIETLPQSEQASLQDALFGWQYPFLRSLRSSTLFSPCFAIIASRLLDDLGQKSRFDAPIRARSITAAMEMLSAIFSPSSSSSLSSSSSSGESKSWQYLDQAVKEVERHIFVIVKVAFDGMYTRDPVWKDASSSARQFTAIMAKRDAASIKDYVYSLIVARKSLSAKSGADQPSTWRVPHLCTCEALLTDSIEPLTISPNIDGIANFAQALSVTSHLTRLSSRSWLATDKEAKDKRLKAGVKTANETMDRFFKPICNMLRILAEDEPANIKSMLKTEGTGEAVTILILSPNESIANAAQSLIRQAYDVSSRAECFRALFQDIPEATLKGVISSLRTFKDSAARLPEACGQAKRLVRCLTDIIKILCDPTDRLIRDDYWVERHNAQTLISKIWNLMCADIALIFDKTEYWAVMFENEEMTDWMRDAMIFMQEMLDDLRTFEAAATGSGLSSQDPTPRKLSSRGREMIDALNEPFGKLVTWLRLNDKDLLEQTAKVTVRLIDRFTKSRIPINPEVVKRLRKTAEKAKDPKAKLEQLLRPEQVMEMLTALSKHPDHAEEFAKVVEEDERKRMKMAKRNAKSRDAPVSLDSDDDEVQITGMKPGTKPPATATTKGKPSPAFKPALPVKTSGTQGLPTSAKPNVPTFKVKETGPSKPSNKYKTVPSRMKNAIYSHAAMRAARDRSSSDEGDYSDKDQSKPSGLARLGEPKAKAPPPAPAIRHADEQRKTKMLELQGPGGGAHPIRRGQRIMSAAEIQAQSQNKARMRYNPDYSDLHRQILQWDVKHTGTIPPGNFRFPRTIPRSFDSANHYIETFLPLLTLECWNEIVTSREEIDAGTADNEPISGKLAGRVSVDDFVEVFISVDRMNERNPFSEADIVLMKGPCLALGKVHQIIRKQQKVDIVIRCHLGKDDGTVSRGLSNGTNWLIHRLFSLSTVHREYAALMSMPYYDLLDEILNPPHRDKPDLADVYLERAMKAYKVNKPQAAAILTALSSNGFSLIQGPPGTGKTKTILGLVGAFVSNRGRRATTITVGSSNGHQQPAEKLLLCAPSNAAVDEVAKRLIDGVPASDGKIFHPKIVRIGADSAINVSVQGVSIDSLVQKALGGVNGQTTAGEAQANINNARSEMSTLKIEREEKRAEKANTVNNTALLSKLSSEISSLTQRMNDLGDKLDRERDKLTQSNRAMESAKRKVRAEILADADVICATLSGSGHDYLANFDFETVIIDEAAQSVEISSLIPLKYNCQRCIMVGDPNQLPPTVKSREANAAGYNKSLFVRIHASAPEATHLLSIQYRMHPDISSFPSKAFYEGRLLDGPDMAEVTKRAWHVQGDQFPPYAFMHVRGGREERSKHHSIMNPQEASVAVALYAKLVQVCKDIDLSYRVGVITAYKAQVGELKKQFRRRFGDEILSKVDFNTVDGFQGQEKDIIILSCVRGGAGEAGGIGFLSDVRRMNVALTRARSSLFILGDSSALRTNESWGKLVQDATERGVLRDVDVSSFALNAQPQQTFNKPMARKSAAPAKRTGVSPSKQILPAPAGLMTPAELAKSTLANGDAGSSAGSGIGIKRRLMASMKQEDGAESYSDPVKKAKLATVGNGNAAPAFLSKVKQEELEEGEVSTSASDGSGPMHGVEYTNQRHPPGHPRPGPPFSVTSTATTDTSRGPTPSSTASSASNPPRPPTTTQPGDAGIRPPGINGQQQATGSAPLPPLPKKPVSSMFIPRKRNPPPAMRPGQGPSR